MKQQLPDLGFNFDLNAVSPIDGRYSKQTEVLGKYFSEGALIRYRVFVEMKYFMFMRTKLMLDNPSKVQDAFLPMALDSIHEDFTLGDAARVKEIEAGINHDVKAVELFVKEKLEALGFGSQKEWVHFGLTSQDITNTALPLMMKDALKNVFLPKAQDLINALGEKAGAWRYIPMLAHTHGQPASPTAVGKEIAVFVERLSMAKADFKIPKAKFGGATGNLNAHYAAMPDEDWSGLMRNFIETLGLDSYLITTQIAHYDDYGALFDAMKRFNTILIDFCTDMWLYISMNYFKQIPKEGEVGSSTMPHKVNPIDFENAEGNLIIANSMFECLSRTLPVSRLQRDLRDSTVTRNIGVPFAHTLIAWNSIMKGMKKIELNGEKLQEDLEDNWAVVTEGIQTYLRTINYPDPYEALKKFSRGKKIGKHEIQAFIKHLEITEEQKQYLLRITPHTYLGSAKEKKQEMV